MTHEALIRNWALLRGWVDQDREFLRSKARIEAAAALWEGEKRDASRLLPAGRPLAEGEEILASRRADLRASVVAFIEASAAAAGQDTSSHAVDGERSACRGVARGCRRHSLLGSLSSRTRGILQFICETMGRARGGRACPRRRCRASQPDLAIRPERTSRSGDPSGRHRWQRRLQPEGLTDLTGWHYRSQVGTTRTPVQLRLGTRHQGSGQQADHARCDGPCHS